MYKNLPKDYRQLIPHFSTKLALELYSRLVARVQVDVPAGGVWFKTSQQVPVWVPMDPKRCATEIVKRMFRERMTDAKRTHSFAQSMIDADRVRRGLEPEATLEQHVKATGLSIPKGFRISSSTI